VGRTSELARATATRRKLANDDRWLDEEARAQEERADFRRRREAVIAECERRGKSDLAAGCVCADRGIDYGE